MSMSVSREDFEVKINEVGQNLYISHFHLKIHNKMTEELKACLQEYPPFFGWSRMAHYEAGVLRLTRAYDKDSLGILKILNIIQSDYRFWNCSDALDNHQLEQDKNFVMKEENDLVKGLLQIRDKVISHTDSRLYPEKRSYFEERRKSLEEKGIIFDSVDELFKDYILSGRAEEDASKILDVKVPVFSEFAQLTTKGIEICNRYMVKLGMPPIELKLEGIDR